MNLNLILNLSNVKISTRWFTRVPSEIMMITLKRFLFIKLLRGCACRLWPTGLHWHRGSYRAEVRLTGADTATSPSLSLVSSHHPAIPLDESDLSGARAGMKAGVKILLLKRWRNIRKIRYFEVRNKMYIYSGMEPNQSPSYIWPSSLGSLYWKRSHLL